SPEWQLFSATLLISLLVGVVSGMAPALQGSKADLTAAVKNEPGLLSSRFRRLSWRNALGVAPFAEALVLLAWSGLFLPSARQALLFELGFDAQNLVFNQISIGESYQSARQAKQFFRDMRRRVAALPEAQSVCLAEGSLLDGQGYLRRHKLSIAG